LHGLSGQGDIFEDIPYLRAWVNMEWNEKWTTDFRADLKEQVEEYHFNTYAENWNRRDEVRRALSSIPSLMTWDDHDIFDGAGSYPPLIHNSPMMMGLFSAAQKMRLLFQHHTTIDKARQHHLFGHEGYNFFARCGPRLAIVGTDGRTERRKECTMNKLGR
jgi:phosphodiesterase/alkaline phosphatase D-like protein